MGSVEVKKRDKKKSAQAQPGWKDIPIGGMILKAGNAFEHKTGGWRTFRPILDKAKCINCLTCWFYCPDASINVEDGKLTGFDLEHCKGCGICSKICPVKGSAIKMEKET